MYATQRWQQPRIAAPQACLVPNSHVMPAAAGPYELNHSMRTPRIVSQAQGQVRTVPQLLFQQQQPQQIHTLQPVASHVDKWRISVPCAAQHGAQPIRVSPGRPVLQQAVDPGLQEQLLNASANAPAEDTDNPVQETEQVPDDTKAENQEHTELEILKQPLQLQPGQAPHVLEVQTDMVGVSMPSTVQPELSPKPVAKATETSATQDDFHPLTQEQAQTQPDQVSMAKDSESQELEEAPVGANDPVTDIGVRDVISNENQSPDELCDGDIHTSSKETSTAQEAQEPEVRRLKHRHQSSPVQLHRHHRHNLEHTQSSLSKRQYSELLQSRQAMTPSLPVKPTPVVPNGIASDSSAQLQASPMTALAQRSVLTPQTPFTVHKAHLGTTTSLDGSAVFTPRSATPLAVTPRAVTPQICARDSQVGARLYGARSPTPDYRQPFRPVILGASSPPASVTQNLQGIFLPGRSEAENSAATPRGPTPTWPWSSCHTKGFSPRTPRLPGYSSPTPLRRSPSPGEPLRCSSALGTQQQELVACAAPAVASTQRLNCTSPEGAYAQIVLPPPAQRSVSNLHQVGASSRAGTLSPPAQRSVSNPHQVGASSGAGTLLWCPDAGTATPQGAVQQQLAATAATKDAAVAAAPSQQHGCQRTKQASPGSTSPGARRTSPERLASSQFSASIEKEVLGDSRRRRWSSEVAPKVPCATPAVGRDPRSSTLTETSFTPAFMRLQEKLSHLTEEGTVSL